MPLEGKEEWVVTDMEDMDLLLKKGECNCEWNEEKCERCKKTKENKKEKKRANYFLLSFPRSFPLQKDAATWSGALKL